MFQPPSLQESLMQPGNAGGSNWGSIAFDAGRQIAVGLTMNLPFVVALVPRAHMQAEAQSDQYKEFEFACVKPPWGVLTGVDMEHGTIAWQIPVGDAPITHRNIGMPGLGGPIVTASGLVFIAATFDDRLRAFETRTGKLLWEVKLPAGGQATPMTYSVAGRQYLVIAAGGYKGDTTRGDYVVAYALPR
jgi:quinoprotein glucose dehydrogenase